MIISIIKQYYDRTNFHEDFIFVTRIIAKIRIFNEISDVYPATCSTINVSLIVPISDVLMSILCLKGQLCIKVLFAPQKYIFWSVTLSQIIIKFDSLAKATFTSLIYFVFTIFVFKKFFQVSLYCSNVSFIFFVFFYVCITISEDGPK